MNQRNEKVEHVLAWALRNGYCFAESALDAYCANCQISWSRDSNDCVTFYAKGLQPSYGGY